MRHLAALAQALERHRGRDPRIADWLARLSQYDRAAEIGAQAATRWATCWMASPCAASLGTGPEAIRIEDVMDSCGLALFQLSESQYPHPTRKVAAWLLLGLSRLIHQLPPNPDPNAPRALLIVDELGALGASARHLRPLLGRAREAGLAVVVTTQGLTDVEAVDRSLVHQLLQDTSWQCGFRQGGPRDAELMRGLFGQAWVADESWTNDGRVTKRQVQRWRVDVDEWMNHLEPGAGWLRIAPIEGRWRQERVRVAWPQTPNPEPGPNSGTQPGGPLARVRTPGTQPQSDRSQPPGWPLPSAAPRAESEAAGALPGAPRPLSAELLSRLPADFLAKTKVGPIPRARRDLGPCLLWTGAKHATKGYGRHYAGQDWLAHRFAWTKAYGPIPDDITVDHLCRVVLCVRPDHLELVNNAENLRRRHQAARGT